MEYRMLSEGERIEEGDEWTQNDSVWRPAFPENIGEDPGEYGVTKWRRPLPSRGEWREMGPEEVLTAEDEGTVSCYPEGWLGAKHLASGTWIGQKVGPQMHPMYPGMVAFHFRTRRPSPPAAGGKSAPLPEERIAALTVGTPPGRGLIHEDIRRVCPTCQRDVPAYLPRCKCGALDLPVYRLTPAPERPR